MTAAQSIIWTTTSLFRTPGQGDGELSSSHAKEGDFSLERITQLKLANGKKQNQKPQKPARTHQARQSSLHLERQQQLPTWRQTQNAKAIAGLAEAK